MRGSDIVNRLKSRIPIKTNFFSDEIQVTSLTKNVLEITAETASAHGLVTNDYVTILGAKTPIPISFLSRTISIISIKRDGQYAVATTEFNHNLKETDLITISGANEPIFNVNKIRVSIINNNTIRYYISSGIETEATGTITITVKKLAYVKTSIPNDLTFSKSINQNEIYVEISGSSEADYNGFKKLIGVIDNETFVIEVDNEPPPDSGSPNLLQDKASTYNGLKIITSTPTTTSFTYNVEIEPEDDAIGDVLCRFSYRIAGVANIQAALNSYTIKNTNEYWMFVALTGATANKDRNTQTDATAAIGSNSFYSQDIITTFSIYVFSNTSDEYAAFYTKDYMHNDIYQLFVSNICGYSFSSSFNQSRFLTVVSTGNDEYEYSGPYYIHEFRFETTERVNNCDIIGNETVALRTVNINHQLKDTSASEFVRSTTTELP